jgi:hypothetical protein
MLDYLNISLYTVYIISQMYTYIAEFIVVIVIVYVILAIGNILNASPNKNKQIHMG